MIFTACALVAKRYGATLMNGMDYYTFQASIYSTLAKSLGDSKKQNQRLDLLLEVFAEIKMNNNENQSAIDNFIQWVSEISNCINSDYWNGEDVMGIFFNEFNRYKKKSDSGQIFTPEHITSFMYRLIHVHKEDKILDAACGSGGFLVKAMSKMIKESGGIKSDRAKTIKSTQLFGIEFDREIFALACANMLIHKDGKTNLEQLDSREEKAAKWIKSKNISKVLMNPPFETKYGCLKIVKNVLDNVPQHTMCAFILPDKKLEKDKSNGKKIIKNHQLQKIIKLPEKTFSEGVTTSIFIFEAGIPQNDKEIFCCYLEDDGLETVKNQGRQDIKNKWQAIENKWIDIIDKQNGHNTIQWIKPNEHLSYQMPEKEFEIFEEDFAKTMMDDLMFDQKINVKEFSENLINKVMYDSSVAVIENTINISITNGDKNEKIKINKWSDFSLKELGFTIQLAKGDLKAQKQEEGNIPLVSSGKINNGICKYIATTDKSEIFKAGTITVDMFGKAFYQQKDFYAVAHGRVNMLTKEKPYNRFVGMFIAKSIEIVAQKFEFSDMCNSTVLSKIKIKLPKTKEGEPDFEYMEQYIQNIEAKAKNNLNNLKLCTI